MKLRLCGNAYEITWYNIVSLLLVPIILTLTFVFQNVHQVIYVPLACGICAMIIFVNYPSIVIFLHSRPIYYDDLIIKNYEGEGHIYDEGFRKKYQVIFQWIASVTSSCMIGLTVEVWYYKDDIFTHSNNNVNAFITMGVIGGMLKLYYGATMILGRILLSALKYFKKKEQEKLRRANQERTLVELTGIGVTIADEDEEAIPIIPRTVSCDNVKLAGFKPTLMVDLFN